MLPIKQKMKTSKESGMMHVTLKCFHLQCGQQPLSHPTQFPIYQALRLKRTVWLLRPPEGGGGGGVCTHLIPENNALISPNPWKKIPQLPESIFPLLPKSLKLMPSASPQNPKTIGQSSLKCIFLSILLNSDMSHPALDRGPLRIQCIHVGSSLLSLRVFVNLWLAISLKLLKILRWNFQNLFEIWFPSDK